MSHDVNRYRMFLWGGGGGEGGGVYDLIGSPFVQLECKLLHIAFSYCIDYIHCNSAANPFKSCLTTVSIVQKLFNFNNVFAKGRNNIVEVFESLTTSF